MRSSLFCLIISAVAACSATGGARASSWQEEFGISECALAPTGRNDYFILEPGFQIVLEGKKGKLQITVLDETKSVDGVTTRVVEEREWQDGELVEVARNFFAICPGTKDVFYFGEDVDVYEDGETVSRAGTWLAGKDGARPGLMMPGKPRVGMKYYQEIAPGIAMDRAEIMSLDAPQMTPAGVFTRCLMINESSALSSEREVKVYAPGIGLIRDADLLVTRYGFMPTKGREV
jgi:hypothetical protein